MAYDASAWQNFYVMTGGAAAAITGLVFVAMSIHARAIIAHPLLGNRAVTTLISLLTQLALAGVVLVPGQSTLAVGIEVEVAAVLSMIWTGVSIIRTPRGAFIGPKRSRTRAVVEAIAGSIWIIVFVASGISLIVRAGGGFYLLALVMLLMFVWNVYISWSLITDVAD